MVNIVSFNFVEDITFFFLISPLVKSLDKLSNKNDIMACINKNKPIIVPFEKSNKPITSLYKNTGRVMNFPPTARGTP